MTAIRRMPRVAITAAVLMLAGSLALGGSAGAQTATNDQSPVNLSNTINMANGSAASKATVVEGDARFEVLTPEVVRLEYSPSGSFLNEPTFDILDRNFTVEGAISLARLGATVAG